MTKPNLIRNQPLPNYQSPTPKPSDQEQMVAALLQANEIIRKKRRWFVIRLAFIILLGAFAAYVIWLKNKPTALERVDARMIERLYAK